MMICFVLVDNFGLDVHEKEKEKEKNVVCGGCCVCGTLENKKKWKKIIIIWDWVFELMDI